MTTAPPTYSNMQAQQAQADARKRERLINEIVVTIHVDGKSYRFVAGDVTARQAGLLRVQAESPFRDPLAFLLAHLRANLLTGGRCPLDLAAQLIFLARLQAGEDVTLDDVADALTVRAELELELPADMPDISPDEEVFPDPPASGGGS